MTDAAKWWSDRPTLVTGATGLLGGWMVRHLLEMGADVVCLVRDHVPDSVLFSEDLLGSVRVVRGDLCDLQLLERTLGEYEVDTVMHLAAQTIVGVGQRTPLSTFESNIRGTYLLLEACRRTPGVRSIVVASSDKAYGANDRQPYDESMPLEGRAPYDVSKSCADLITKSYAETYDLPVAVTRCGNFYGGGDLNWSRIVPGTIRSILRGNRPIIRSDGKFIRDYFYVKDSAAAYSLLAQRLHEDPARFAGEAFNFSTDEPLTVLEVVEAIRGEMQSDLTPEVLDQVSHEIRVQHLDAGKARRELSWKPRFTFQEALGETVAWYRDFLRADA